MNVNQARRANEAVSNYHNQLGWGRTEVSVEVEVNGAVFTRRLDIADTTNPESLRGIEHKTGYQTASDDILWEVDRDAQLVKDGWDIEWVFEGKASESLLEALEDAGIPYKFINN